MSDEDNVVHFTGATKLDIPALTVLQAAIDNDLEDVVIIGYRKDGEGYYASSMADGAQVLWLVESFKKVLLEP